MGFFSKKIKNQDEVFQRLSQRDKKVSEKAKSEFISCLNSDHIVYLVKKFKEIEDQETRLAILEIFSKKRDILSEEDLRQILTLITYPDSLFRETFKEILTAVTPDNMKALTECLSQTSDISIHKTIQFGIEKSGLLSMFLQSWNQFTIKEQILYLESLVLLQNPKTYPIFIDIMKDEAVEAKREEKKILQVEFTKHVEKLKRPEFLDACIKSMPAISPTMRYSVFKCLQRHGDAFFKKIFDGLGKKSENYRQNVLKLIEQLNDPVSYPYLFPFLLDPYKSIPQIISDTISKLVKSFCEELETMTDAELKSEAILNRVKFYTDPLENNLTERHFQCIKTLTECLLRLGKYLPDVILRNFAKLFKYNENYVKSFLKGLEPTERKSFLINACCYKDEETGRTALKILSDPTENYIVETLNTLLLEHFMNVPHSLQTEVINLMMNPKLQSFVTEVLYHQDPELRSRILWILGESGSQNALQILETKLRDPDFVVRENILKILDLPHFRNNAGTEMLMNFLKDTDQSIVLQTIEKLKDRDHPAVISNLSKAMSSTNAEVKTAAHKAIAFITRRKYLSGFDKMNPEMRLSIGSSLVKMDPNFMEDTTSDLSASDQRTRVLSAKILEVLVDFITPDLKTHLICAINDPDPSIRAVVVMALGKIGGPGVDTMLVSYLKDQDDRVRANTVEAMATIGNPSLINEIVPCLYDENNRVRGNAITTLWKLGYYQIYEPVMQMLRNPDKWMRASAVFALGELKDTRFFPMLMSVLRDPDADVRRNVILALAKIAPPYMLAPYIRPLRFDPDENVRKEVLAVLSPKPVPTANTPK